MGVMRFLVLPELLADDWPEATAAYVTGLDGRVFPSRIERQDNLLTCTRAVSDSGKLHIPWMAGPRGRLVLTTASLPENERPYLLTLELARGKIGEVRDQAFQWQFAGMALPSEFSSTVSAAFRLFSQASAKRSNPDESSRIAQEALILACDAADLLGRAYTVQRLQNRALSTTHPPALLGCRADTSVSREPYTGAFFETFSAAVVPIEWTTVEPTEGHYHWEELDELVDCCQSHRAVIRGGPLVDLAPGGLPPWLAQWGDDFLNLQSFVCDYIETTVRRFAGRIRIWEVAARGNTGGVLSLTEEQRLTLTARCLDSAQRNDTDAQLFIRVDRPWGDYQSGGQYRLTPFQFVDALVRSSLGLSGVNLEIPLGYDAMRGTGRDLLSYSRLIDLWSLLGVQLHVTLAIPSAAGADPQAVIPITAVPEEIRANGESGQAAWIEKFASLLIAKPSVTGVFWTSYHDGVPHRFAQAGLVRADGERKPGHDVFQHLRATRPPALATEEGNTDGTWIQE